MLPWFASSIPAEFHSYCLSRHQSIIQRYRHSQISQRIMKSSTSIISTWLLHIQALAKHLKTSFAGAIWRHTKFAFQTSATMVVLLASLSRPLHASIHCLHAMTSAWWGFNSNSSFCLFLKFVCERGRGAQNIPYPPWVNSYYP